MSDTYERLAALLVEKFDTGPATLNDQTTFAELDFDSLAIIELFVTIQEQWHVPLDDAQAQTDLTLGQLVSLVDRFDVDDPTR
ncbi:acyl carrier protein [Kitasatospora mediocidica]|uniref:acyl carrier protein n=1 Tax=Kitasatospora mediocidica TaxID=58352 RepID=UPI0005605302|nr:acyl carrier protein [Kitasatospora mediocidica]